MARTALTVTPITRAGVALGSSAANADGHSVANDGKTFVYVNNGGGAPITVTVLTPGTVDGLAIADRAVTVANATNRLIGPFPKDIYNQADGTVHVNFSGVTTVTCGAHSLP